MIFPSRDDDVFFLDWPRESDLLARSSLGAVFFFVLVWFLFFLCLQVIWGISMQLASKRDHPSLLTRHGVRRTDFKQ